MPHTPPQIRNSTSKASTQRNTTPAFAATPTTPHTQQPRLFIMAQQLDYVSICGSCPAGDGWGPSVTTETTLHGVPYAPFSKGDKLGRMADWTAEGKDRERGGRTQYNRNFRGTLDLFCWIFATFLSGGTVSLSIYHKASPTPLHPNCFFFPYTKLGPFFSRPAGVRIQPRRYFQRPSRRGRIHLLRCHQHPRYRQD